MHDELGDRTFMVKIYEYDEPLPLKIFKHPINIMKKASQMGRTHAGIQLLNKLYRKEIKCSADELS